MNRMTQGIGLVLISSSLILHGCHRAPQDERKDEQNPPGTGGVHGAHFLPGGSRVAPSGSSGLGSSGAAPSSAGSARGGFGASGAAHGGTS